MILYLSAATNPTTFNKLFNENKVYGSFQVQKFNTNIIRGLSELVEVVAVASLPYKNINAGRIEEKYKNLNYICVKNRRGILRKGFRQKDVYDECDKIISKNMVKAIICDAYSGGLSIIAIKLAKKYKIPSYAVVTDVPEFVNTLEMTCLDRITAKYMKRYDNYILLTTQMNEIVNPHKKPYMVMEGSCGEPISNITRKSDKKIVLYTGVLWKKYAGLDFLTNGFIKANIPNVELHFYGNGDYKEELIEISKKYPNVKYMGCVTNDIICEKQREATLLVNPRPSKQEFCKYSFPSKTFEYLLSGTPALITRLPGMGEEYFQYVYTLDDETDNGVCDQLKYILSLSKEELDEKGQKAFEFVSKYKNYKVQSRRIYEFIERQNESR